MNPISSGINRASDYLKNLRGSSTTAPVSPMSTVQAMKKNPAVPTNPASTNPTPVVSTPVTQSPQAKAYIETIKSPTPQNNASTTFTTPSGAVVDASGKAISTPTEKPSEPTVGTQTQQTPINPALSAYLNQYKLSQDAVREAGTRLSELQIQAKRDRENALSRGLTTGFGEREAARVNRENAFQLEAAAAAYNALNQGMPKPIQIGDTLLDPNTGQVIYQKPVETKTEPGFSLSPGENRYDASGNLIASGGVKPPSAAQEAKQLESEDRQKAAEQQAGQSIGLINNLLTGDRYKKISGALQTGSIPFLGDRAAVNEYDQLQAMLKLGIRSLIKGQGSVSDYEGKILGQAASALSRLTNENQMKEALQKVRGVLKTNIGQITTVEVTNPETGEKIMADLSGPEIYQLIIDGNTIAYK